ncbi:protein ARV1, putative [Hepatocystis sp. ex Piliocolobus tephrosceles]|nr:protein ARV1, putative [Hepatocystis sp. ex Piliocolobus tephrosceles]
MICTKCGRSNTSLYTEYNKTNIKLNECNKCNQICDEYMEKNTFLIFLNILFLKPEIYRHIIFNRLKYHDKGIHKFFFKIIFIFSIINAYLHPNFDNDNINKSDLISKYIFYTNFENLSKNTTLSNYCSSYTLFVYKYNDKHKLYDLYNIFNTENVTNLMNIHKHKLLTCIFNKKYKEHNMCVLNKTLEYSNEYDDKRLIDIFILNNIKNDHNNNNNNNNKHNINNTNMYKNKDKVHINKNKTNNKTNNENDKKEKNNENEKKERNNENEKKEKNVKKQLFILNGKEEGITTNADVTYVTGKETIKNSSFTEFIKKIFVFIKNKIKYKSVIQIKKNDILLKNDIITIKQSEKYKNLHQLINIHVYYNFHDYEIIFETKEKENFDITYIMKKIKILFYYEKLLKNNNDTTDIINADNVINEYLKKKKKKNENNSTIPVIPTDNITHISDYCYDYKKDSIFHEELCYSNNYSLEYNQSSLKLVCDKIFNYINLSLNKKLDEIKKNKKNKDKFKIKQISMYSKILYSNLDDEKYILKICNSTLSIKKLKFVTINYLSYFIFLCIFTYLLKLYQQRKYKKKITMIKYNYLFMLFVLSNYSLAIYFILKVFNYNYINIYLQIYNIICNIIAYHTFISTDHNYILYSTFAVISSYILKNILIIKIFDYI